MFYCYVASVKFEIFTIGKVTRRASIEKSEKKLATMLECGSFCGEIAVALRIITRCDGSNNVEFGFGKGAWKSSVIGVSTSRN